MGLDILVVLIISSNTERRPTVLLQALESVLMAPIALRGEEIFQWPQGLARFLVSERPAQDLM